MEKKIAASDLGDAIQSVSVENIPNAVSVRLHLLALVYPCFDCVSNMTV